MPINDFKPFAAGPGANVTSQADWENLPALLSGFMSGKASSAQINKAFRQASFIAAALAQFVSEKTDQDVLDDGDLPGFVEKLTAGFAAQYLSRSNPFGDIASDGPAAIATALSNLGLGELALAGTMTGAFESIGYLKIPAIIGGAKRTLIVQWGLASGTTGKIATTYATTFPNAVLQVICSVADKSSGSGAVTLAVNQADITSLASRATVTITPSSSDFQGTTTARFISIGY